MITYSNPHADEKEDETQLIDEIPEMAVPTAESAINHGMSLIH